MLQTGFWRLYVFGGGRKRSSPMMLIISILALIGALRFRKRAPAAGIGQATKAGIGQATKKGAAA
jgi:hypothetical protein